jgi:hypothetical protein
MFLRSANANFLTSSHDTNSQTKFLSFSATYRNRRPGSAFSPATVSIDELLLCSVAEAAGSKPRPALA